MESKESEDKIVGMTEDGKEIGKFKERNSRMKNLTDRRRKTPRPWEDPRKKRMTRTSKSKYSQ